MAWHSLFKYDLEQVVYPNGQPEKLIDDAFWPHLSLEGADLARASSTELRQRCHGQTHTSQGNEQGTQRWNNLNDPCRNRNAT